MTTTLTRPTGRRRASAYARLANLYFYDYYLSALIAWSLVATHRFHGRTLLTLALLDLGWVGVVAATVTLDDVTGARDGSDSRNYDPDQGQLRNRANKPLLAGEITISQALRFGYAMAAGGALLWGLAIAVAPHRPWWVVPVASFVLFISVQYSYGLKLSYHRAQELVLLLSPGLMVLVPYALLTGHVTWLAALESYLFGLWSLLVSTYSNMNDVLGDMAAGRKNLATSLAPYRYRRVVGAISLTEVIAIVAALWAGAGSWWLLAFLAPVLLIRVRQMALGLAGTDVLTARKLGMTATRIGAVCLVIANLALIN